MRIHLCMYFNVSACKYKVHICHCDHEEVSNSNSRKGNKKEVVYESWKTINPLKEKLAVDQHRNLLAAEANSVSHSERSKSDLGDSFDPLSDLPPEIVSNLPFLNLTFQPASHPQPLHYKDTKLPISGAVSMGTALRTEEQKLRDRKKISCFDPSHKKVLRAKKSTAENEVRRSRQICTDQSFQYV